ncbi:hypothetical protein BGX27_009306 [Mortierella sp. AM989]|nr:hypothetical protein BGX27_009306 [Mortierella sp. AM989]
MIAMLVRDKTSHAIWIDTLDGFSGQRASDVARAHLLRQIGGSKGGMPAEDRAIQMTTNGATNLYVGHATMVHTARELGRLAVDFGLVVMISFSEEQSPSILATSSSKPSLGSSWRYATDLQLYISRLNVQHRQRVTEFSMGKTANKPDSNLFDADSDEDYDTASVEGVNGVSALRLAEILKSKRLVR